MSSFRTRRLFGSPFAVRLLTSSHGSTHIWAWALCAERFGVAELISEDFQHGRLYGTVQALDPFAV